MREISILAIGAFGLQLFTLAPHVVAHEVPANEGSRLAVGSIDEAVEIAFLANCNGAAASVDGASIVPLENREMSFEISFSEPTGTIAEQRKLFVLGDGEYQSVQVPFADFGSGPAIPVILRVENLTRSGCQLAASFGRIISVDTGATRMAGPDIYFSSDLHELF